MVQQTQQLTHDVEGDSIATALTLQVVGDAGVYAGTTTLHLL